jgi:hypothetical protein
VQLVNSEMIRTRRGQVGIKGMLFYGLVTDLANNSSSGKFKKFTIESSDIGIIVIVKNISK